MAVALSRAGYGSLEDVMEWTPYRMSQVLFIHAKLMEADDRRTVALHALASRGKEDDVRKILRDG